MLRPSSSAEAAVAKSAAPDLASISMKGRMSTTVGALAGDDGSPSTASVQAVRNTQSGLIRI